MKPKLSKNIWIICKYAMPEKYFFGTRHFNFSYEWIKKGHQVTIFTSNWNHLTNKLPVFDGKSMTEILRGVRTVWLQGYRNKSSNSFARIIGWFHFELAVLKEYRNHIHVETEKVDNRPDVVIASSLSLFSIISGYIISRKFNAKFIVEIRDIWPLTVIEIGGFSKLNPMVMFMSWLEKFGYRKSSAIVGTMPNLVEHVQQVEPKFNKVVCIPQGIRDEMLDQHEYIQDEELTKLLKQPGFKVGYAGTINAANPIHTLFEAAQILGPDSDIEYFILGRGNERDAYIKKYGHLKQIHFINPIEKKYVRDFLSYMDVCFDSFTGGTGKFGLSRNKWVDYMAASKPIICTFSGFPTILDEAQCGTYIEYDDNFALANELKRYRDMSSDERLKLGSNARQYVETQLTFSHLASRFEELF